MKNILIALDLTEIDDILIKYAYSLKKQGLFQTVHFVHNLKISDIDDVLQELLGDKDIKAIISKNLQNKINKIFENEAFDLRILEEENTEHSLMEYSRLEGIHTACLGIKHEDDGTGAMAQKFIRIFKGNIILVPTSPSFSWNKALVPTDFSTPFSKVVQTVDNIKTIIPTLDLKVLRSFSIPSFFFPFIDDKKAIQQAEKHIFSQYKEVSKKLKLEDKGLSFIARYQGDHSISEVINKEVKSYGADVIIMAAKGSSKISSIFIGSTINEMVNITPQQTLYIIK